MIDRTRLLDCDLISDDRLTRFPKAFIEFPMIRGAFDLKAGDGAGGLSAGIFFVAGEKGEPRPTLLLEVPREGRIPLALRIEASQAASTWAGIAYMRDLVVFEVDPGSVFEVALNDSRACGTFSILAEPGSDLSGSVTRLAGTDVPLYLPDIGPAH